MLFGYLTANVEALPKEQPDRLDANYSDFYNFDPKVTRRLVMTQP